MKPLRLVVLGLLAVLPACTSQHSPSADGPSKDLRRSAAQFYEAYAQDLRTHRREKLANYYDPGGALLVIAGHRKHFSRAALDSFYRGAWQGPAYFAWDNLAFDSLSSNLVLVTGGFRWLGPGTRDTARYIYASILQAGDSGPVIRLEHETPAPSSKR